MLYIVKGKGPNILGDNWLEHLILDWKALAALVNYVSSNKLGELLNVTDIGKTRQLRTKVII